MAGVYEVQKLEREYYNGEDIDSTETIENPGTICLYDETANINEVYYVLSEVPSTWLLNGVSVNNTDVYWYTNEQEKIATVTFYSEGGLGDVHFTTFNINRFKKNGKMEWYYVKRQADGFIHYIEILTVKKQ